MEIFSYIPELLNNLWLYGILFLAVLTAVVFIHEMGHFLAARHFGVRAEIFSLGFGRELIGRNDRKGTRWSLRLYPVGGYVRMFAPYATSELLLLPPAELNQTYFIKPLYQKFLITAAGPFMNFLFAILLLTLTYMTIGQPSGEPYISAIEVGSPAQLGGLKIDDLITNVDGRNMADTQSVKDAISGKTGQVVKLEVKRGVDILNFKLIPKELKETNSYGFPTHRGYLGAIWPSYGFNIGDIYEVDGVDTSNNIGLARALLKKNFGREVVIKFGKKIPNKLLVFVNPKFNQGLSDSSQKDYQTLILGRRPLDQMKRADPVSAFSNALALTWKGVNQTLGTVFQVMFGEKKTTELGGVVKISKMTAKMAGEGLFIFLTFIAMLSVNLGIVNLLPVPLLDGGHLLFYLIEAVKGSPVPLKWRVYIYGIAFVFLALTAFLINLNDVRLLFNNF